MTTAERNWMRQVDEAVRGLMEWDGRVMREEIDRRKDAKEAARLERVQKFLLPLLKILARTLKDLAARIESWGAVMAGGSLADRLRATDGFRGAAIEARDELQYCYSRQYYKCEIKNQAHLVDRRRLTPESAVLLVLRNVTPSWIADFVEQVLGVDRLLVGSMVAAHVVATAALTALIAHKMGPDGRKSYRRALVAELRAGWTQSAIRVWLKEASVTPRQALAILAVAWVVWQLLRSSSRSRALNGLRRLWRLVHRGRVDDVSSIVRAPVSSNSALQSELSAASPLDLFMEHATRLWDSLIAASVLLVEDLRDRPRLLESDADLRPQLRTLVAHVRAAADSMSDLRNAAKFHREQCRLEHKYSSSYMEERLQRFAGGGETKAQRSEARRNAFALRTVQRAAPLEEYSAAPNSRSSSSKALHSPPSRSDFEEDEEDEEEANNLFGRIRPSHPRQPSREVDWMEMV